MVGYKTEKEHREGVTSLFPSEYEIAGSQAGPV